MAAVWTTKLRWTTEFSADSVEWCPVTPYINVLVCGTYQLAEDQSIEEKQLRLGKIYLFVVDNDTTELSPIQTIDSPGILDQKWCYHTIRNYPVLAVVTSGGTLKIYRLIDENGTLQLKLWLEHLIDPNELVLSIDWSTNKTVSAEPRIIVSDTKGLVYIFSLIGETIQLIDTWEGHRFAAWIAAFNYWNPDVFYSGGDDCLLKSYDIRVPKKAVAVNKNHEAGVTVIRSHTDVEHQLLTGSYDEKVRLWDTRTFKSCLTEEGVGGGLWRLKWHPSKSNIVLAACMYNGFGVLNVTDKIEVLCRYSEPDNLAYGADWKFDGETSVVATCSFYDCKLYVSEITF